MIDVLKKQFNIEIYVFNLNIKNTKVDSKILNQDDIKIIPTNYYETYDQDVLDKEIDKICNKIKCKFRNDYSNSTIRNAIRQMYSEYRVGLFLEKNKNKYDGAVICGPDYYLLNSINLEDVNNSLKNNNVYTTMVNDAQGYTNGFYFGKLELLIPILKRYEKIELYLPINKDYEYLLKKSFEDNKINRSVTHLFFFKIRANNMIAWQGNRNCYGKCKDIEVKYKSLFNKLKLEINEK